MNFEMFSQESLFSLFQQAPVALAYLKGEELLVDVANTQILELWGKEKEIIGLPLIEALPEISAQEFPDLLKKVYSTGIEQRGYETLAKLQRHGELEDAYFNYIYAPVRDQEGIITGVSVVATEVTEQVLAKKSLIDSEKKFKGLVLEADVATAIYVGQEMRIEVANDAMLDVWRKDGKVIGKTLNEALPELEGQPFHQLLQQVFLTGITYKATEDPVDLIVEGKLQRFYYNFSYKALRNSKGEIYGILNMAVDVTEQVLVRQKAQNNENKLKDLILQAPVAMAVIKGKEFIIETANAKSLEIWCRTEAVIGQKVVDVFPELIEQGFIGILDNVYHNGEPFYGTELPVTIMYNNGPKTLYINFVYHPIYENGEVTSIMSLGYDVTDLVLSRQRAEESEARFKNLVDKAPVPTALLSGENMVLELVNDAMLEIWGRDRTILNRELLDFMPELKGQAYPDLLRRVYETGEEYTNTESKAEIIVNGELKVYYFNFTYKQITFQENLKSILVMCIDVTDQVLSRKLIEENELKLKESQQKLEELADSMPQIVWTARADGYLDYYNQQWYDYTGFSRENFGDESWAPVLHPDDLDRVVDTWYKCVQTGTVYEIEYRFIDRFREGEYRWFLGRAVPIKNEAGEIIRWIGTNTDINEFKILQKQKDNFLGIASHELKTPVTSIKAYTQVLEAMLRTDGDAKKAALVNKMDLQLNKLTSLIGDLLDVTKIQTGRMQFNDASFDFNTLIQEIIEELQRTTKHELVPKLEFEGSVFADRDRIGQVITNLISNAIKYSPQADKVIIYSRADGNNVRLCVQDFGIGIPANKRERVFEQFYRVSGTKEHTFPGLGLGLYISSEIVKREGGEIWVSSTEGKGSTFCFCLPQDINAKN
ncbi:PAS domain-containing sensor histidine kinase [Desertivirga arenae]|uniref:PAS domain-containing sensor histidine kinase n=1 Tax=Desertivirga arenae TaxID=2810309 RepID=UPI001A97CDC8|nr:PAS domain-containing protein [Pedobacter sp. SYSU D00823]